MLVVETHSCRSNCGDRAIRITLQMQRQIYQERKSSPKSKSWGQISGRRPREYPGGCPGEKTYVKPRNPGKDKHFGADVHDPKAGTSMTAGGFKKFGQINFGLNFRSLI